MAESSAVRVGIAFALAAAMAAILPVMLLGSMAVQIRSDLSFGPGILGLVLGTFFGTTAIMSAFFGRLVDLRWGAARSLSASLGATACAMALMAVAPGWSTLMAALAIGGAANAVMHPSISRLFADGMQLRRLGLVLGIKQSAPPAGALVGGLLVPVVALTIGWRWACLAGSLLALGLALTAARAVGGGRISVLPRSNRTRIGLAAGPMQGVVLISVAAGLGSAAGIAAPSFAVDAGVVSGGFSEASAGLIAAAASLVVIGARAGSGWLADLQPLAALPLLVSGMMVVGSLGMAAMSLGPSFFVGGTVLAYAGGWGWGGVLLFLVVQGSPDASAHSTGILMTGLGTGSFLGTLGFGALADATSYDVMWRASALLGVCAAACLLMARSSIFGRRALI